MSHDRTKTLNHNHMIYTINYVIFILLRDIPVYWDEPTCTLALRPSSVFRVRLCLLLIDVTSQEMMASEEQVVWKV